MMEGIEVLNQYIVATAGTANLVFGIILAAISLFFLIVAICAAKEREFLVALSVMLVAFLCFVISMITGFSPYLHKETYEVYQVTINDSVGMNEFNQRYEIINHSGKIYTIREKPMVDKD